MEKTKRINVILSVLASVLILIFFAVLLKNQKSFTEKAGDTKEKEEYSFSFEPSVMTYDGNGVFDPMIGVSVKDASGKDVTERVITVLKKTDQVDHQIIVYRIYHRDGSYETEERNLYLENYSGPSVRFTGSGSVFFAETENDLAAEIIRLGLATADDGYGHDITDKITVSFTSSSSTGNRAIVIGVENFLGDKAEVRSSVVVR